MLMLAENAMQQQPFARHDPYAPECIYQADVTLLEIDTFTIIR